MGLVLGELSTILKADHERFKRDLDKAKGAFNRHAESLKASAAVAGGLIAAGLGAGLLSAIDASSAQTKLRNQLGDPVASEAAGAAAAGAFGRGFTTSLDTAMADASAVFSSGLSAGSQNAKMIEDLTVKAQALSKTFDFDLTKAVGVAGVIMRDGLAKDGTQALDLIARTSQRVAPQFREDILDAAHEYSTFFNSLGFDGPQAFELLARGAEKGTYGIDKTGDVIKELTLIATDMSDKTKGAFDAIGLDAHTMANRILAGGDQAKGAFDQIINGLLDIEDPAERANTAVELFGTPLEDMNKADIPAFLDSLAGLGEGMTDAAGTAQELADAWEGDAGQALQRLKNQVQVALIEKLGAAVPHIEATFGWLSRNSGWVVPLATALGVLAGAIGVVVLAVKVWTAVQTAWGIVMATTLGPILLIVAGIALVVAGIVWLATKTQFFQTIWRWVWDKIGEPVKAIWNWVKDNWPLLIGIITGPIGWIVLLVVRYWGQIVEGTKAAWAWIVAAIKAAWDWVVDLFFRFTPLGLIISNFDKIVSFIRGLPGRVRSAASGLFDGIKDAFRSAINWVIRRWNNLSFSLPSVNVPGIGQVGGATLSTPNIPYLAKGGNVLAAGAVVVGEQGPELLHLPRGAQVEPLSGSGRGGQHAETTITLKIRGDGIVAGLRDDIRVKAGGDVVRHLSPQTGGGWS